MRAIDGQLQRFDKAVSYVGTKALEQKWFCLVFAIFCLFLNIFIWCLRCNKGLQSALFNS